MQCRHVFISYLIGINNTWLKIMYLLNNFVIILLPPFSSYTTWYFHCEKHALMADLLIASLMLHIWSCIPDAFYFFLFLQIQVMECIKSSNITVETSKCWINFTIFTSHDECKLNLFVYLSPLCYLNVMTCSRDIQK